MSANNQNGRDHENEDGQSTHSSLPESAQYIDESTLIPPSSFQVEGESVQVIGESAFAGLDGPATAAGSDVAAKPGFDIKKNLPIVAVGAIGVILIGAVGMKMMGSQPQAVAAPPAARVAQAPAPVAKPRPAMQEPSQGTLVGASASAAGPISDMSAPPAPPASAASKPVAASSDDATKSLEAKTATNTADISNLKDRVSKLEDGGGAKAGATAAAKNSTKTAASGNAKPKASSAKPSAKELERRAEAKERAQKRQAAIAAEKAAKAAHEKKLTDIAGSYRITAVKDNLAWIRHADGDIKTYSLGDVISGLGAISKVDEKAKTVTAGARVIR